MAFFRMDLNVWPLIGCIRLTVSGSGFFKLLFVSGSFIGKR